MVNYCPNCGWRVHDPQSRKCDNCGKLLPGREQRSWLSRFFGWLAAGQRPAVRTRHVVTQSTQYTWHDTATGEKHTAKSLDELPPEVRQRIEEAMGARLHEGGPPVSRFTFRGPSGEQLSYNSLEEMPPEIRRFFERVQRGEDPLERSDYW